MPPAISIEEHMKLTRAENKKLDEAAKAYLKDVAGMPSTVSGKYVGRETFGRYPEFNRPEATPDDDSQRS